MKTFKKAQIIAKNKPVGAYAAGCPENSYGGDSLCRQCDRAR